MEPFKDKERGTKNIRNIVNQFLRDIHQRKGSDNQWIFCCQHLLIWFGGISRVCGYPHKFIVQLLLQPTSANLAVSI